MEYKKDIDPGCNSDDAFSMSSSLMNDVAATSDSVTGNVRHRNPTGDAGHTVAMDDVPCPGDLVGSRVSQFDSATDKVTIVPGQSDTSHTSSSPNHRLSRRRAECVSEPFERRSSSSSPTCPFHGFGSPERHGRSAGIGDCIRGPSKSPERFARAGTVGSASGRLHSSNSHDRRVGVVCGNKSPERRVATAAVLPERRLSVSPERLASNLADSRFNTSPDRLRLAVSPNCLRLHTSPERRRVAVVPECPRLHTSPDCRRLAVSPDCPRLGTSPGRRRLTSAERHRQAGSLDRRVAYGLTG